MSVERINPPTLARPVMDLYAQVAVGPPGGRVVAVAGQVALDAAGELVGRGDHGTQAEQAFRNLALALDAVGAAPEDLVKYTIHVVDSAPELVEPVFAAGRRVFGDRWPLVPSTWLGVAALGLPDWLIEIDALAVVR